MDHLEKARQLLEDAYVDERGMQDVMRQDAAIHAAIAQAEALERIASTMETLVAPGSSDGRKYLRVITTRGDEYY